MFVGVLNGLEHAPFANRESLGRLCFVLAMGLPSAFSFRLLRSTAPPMQRLQADAPRSWAVKWHGAWLAVVVAVPLGIAPLGLAGYFIAAGYFFGYWLSRAAGLDKSSSRSVAFEVGLQNGGMASGLAGAMGKLGTVGLAPAIFSPWMNISGSILANYWSKRPPEDAKIPDHAD